MKKMTLVLCCALLLAQGNYVATASSQTVRPIGIILTIVPAARSLTIKTDAGPEMKLSFDGATRFLRVSPGAKDLENASTISISDLAVGDRILARGRSGADPGSFLAASVIVMSKADIAKKHAAERAEWEKRGVDGVITALNPAAKEITITSGANSGAKPMVIAFAPGAALRRYAPNSVRFSDALSSSFEELKVGDQVKALGISNEDRSRLIAEELVSGSFRAIAATVVSIDPGQNTIVITDLSANKRIQAQVTSDSTIRRLSAEAAQMVAIRIKGGSSPAAASGTPEGERPRTSDLANSGKESSRQPSALDLHAVIEKLPSLSLTDLKSGEAVILSCTNNEDPSRVTVITLLAGAEPVLRSSSRGGQTLNMGSWNLELNMNIGVR